MYPASNGTRMLGSIEQLDLLLFHSVRARKVRRNGVHFQGMRYLSPILAAYVGEEVAVRWDPRDLDEVRVFHREAFPCRAVAVDLSGERVTLREIVRARNQHWQELRATLRDRKATVDTLLHLRRGEVLEGPFMASYLYPLPPRDPASNATATSSPEFVETLEHRALRNPRILPPLPSYRLCYGPPGVGKTLSARRLSQASKVEGFNMLRE